MSAVMRTIGKGVSKVLPAIPIVGDIVTGISSLFKKKKGGGQVQQQPSNPPQVTTKPYNPGINPPDFGSMMGGMVDQGRSMFQQGQSMFRQGRDMVGQGMGMMQGMRDSWRSGDYGGAISRFGQGMGDLVSRGQDMFQQGRSMFQQGREMVGRGRQMIGGIRDEYRKRSMGGYGYY